MCTAFDQSPRKYGFAYKPRDQNSNHSDAVLYAVLSFISYVSFQSLSASGIVIVGTKTQEKQRVLGTLIIMSIKTIMTIKSSDDFFKYK